MLWMQRLDSIKTTPFLPRLGCVELHPRIFKNDHGEVTLKMIWKLGLLGETLL